MLPQLRKHYKEYLIFKFNEALVDPADDMDVAELGAVLMREEKEVPKGDEKDPQYKERLKEVSCRCWCGVEEAQLCLRVASLQVGYACIIFVCCRRNVLLISFVLAHFTCLSVASSCLLHSK